MKDFEPTEEYTGDMILTDRLYEFISDREWNDNEPIDLTSITNAIRNNIPEQSVPYGDNKPNTIVSPKSNTWHLGRIIYFINHPDQIKDIEIDNVCNNFHVLLIPVITDGNHRFMAAAWLNKEHINHQKIHCLYGGRIDLLEYLTGASDTCPNE